VAQLSDVDRRELSSLAYVEDGNYDSVQRIIVEVTIKDNKSYTTFVALV
jgi:hypothetical protein